MNAATPAYDEPRRTVLANGVRVVTAQRRDASLAAVKLFFKVGSREDGDRPGIAHFLEHALLANTASSAARTVYETVEELGGDLNAVTAREYTAVQAVAPARHVDRIVHLLGDLTEPTPIDPVIIDRERRVIREEIRLHADSSQALYDVFLQALWTGHPLGRSVLGTAEGLETISTEALREHWRRYRDADRIVLAGAGAVDHETLVRIAACRFGRLLPAAADVAPVAAPHPAPRRRTFLERESEQTHLVVGAEGVAMSDPRRHAVRLLEIVLGRGASSRLHRALRTDRGLVYSVSSVAMSYADRGYFAVSTSCAAENDALVEDMILDEFAGVRRDGVPEAELTRAKMVYEGSLARNFETVLSLASIIGIEELLYRIEPFGDSLARVNAVTPTDVQHVAREMLAPEHLTIAAVGRVRCQRTCATTS